MTINFPGAVEPAWPTIAASGVLQSVSNSTASTTLMSATVPAKAMGINGRLRLRTYISWSNDTSTKTISFYYGGQLIIPAATFATGTGIQTEIDIVNQGVTNSQAVYPTINTFSTTSNPPNPLSVDTTIAQPYSIVIALGTASLAVSASVQDWILQVWNP